MEARRREVKKLPHHEQESLCTTRPAYRQGRRLTAVKVYTVNDESQHLIISGVPSLGLQDDLRRLCSRFGDVKSLVYIPNYTSENFAEGYHVQYARIQSARFAKRLIDGRAFFGGSLHVCYAPEMESVSETRNKLLQRRHDVAKRCNEENAPSSTSNSSLRELHNPLDDRGQICKSHSNSFVETCVWNGQELSRDPRVLVPDAKLEKISSANYGPQPMHPDWRDVGVTFVVNSQPRKKISALKPQLSKHPKPALSNPLQVSAVSKTNLECTQSRLHTPNSTPPILRLVPSQVKGAQKKIVFHAKPKIITEAKSGNQSLDVTIQSVRDKIRAVSVPNVKIVLDKGRSVYNEGLK